MEIPDRWPSRQWTPRDIARAILLGFGGLFALIGIWTSYYTVAPEEEAVVLRFGRFVASAPPGLHFKMPFGIDQAHKVPVTEVRKIEFGYRTVFAGRRSQYADKTREGSEASLMLTGDLNIAEVEWVVQYKIKDAKDWLFHVQNPEETIRDTGEAVMRAVVGDHTVAEVLTRQREQIAQQVEDQLQVLLDKYGTGAQIVTVKLQNAVPPQPVQAAFNEVNAAQQERAQLENEAQREYNKAIAQARGNALRDVSEAEGYAVDRTNRAVGDVARFNQLVKVYTTSPQVTRRRLFLETIERVLPKVKSVVVASDEGVLKWLPIGEGGGK
ncbi:MAG: FtsH protease activity modulator HflK [Planctomycetota bacterium]|jgi:membrane protease subunit HflK